MSSQTPFASTLVYVDWVREPRGPVVRVFGRTLRGQPCLVRVHGFRRSFLIEVFPDEDVEKLCDSVKKVEHVADAAGVFDLKSIYGVHDSALRMVKVELTEATNASAERVYSSVCAETRRRKRFNFHLDFVGAFLVETDLGGMGTMHVSNFHFRRPLPKRELTQLSSSEPSTPSVAGDSQTFPFFVDGCDDVAYNSLKKTCIVSRLEVDCDIENVMSPQRVDRVVLRKNTNNQLSYVPSLYPLWKERLERLGSVPVEADATTEATVSGSTSQDESLYNALERFIHGEDYQPSSGGSSDDEKADDRVAEDDDSYCSDSESAVSSLDEAVCTAVELAASQFVPSVPSVVVPQSDGGGGDDDDDGLAHPVVRARPVAPLLKRLTFERPPPTSFKRVRHQAPVLVMPKAPGANAQTAVEESVPHRLTWAVPPPKKLLKAFANSPPPPARARKTPTPPPVAAQFDTERLFLVTMCVEVVCARRDNRKRSHPKHDAVLGLAYSIRSEQADRSAHKLRPDEADSRGLGDVCDIVRDADDELKLFRKLDELVAAVDPDFLVGFETQKESWGYLVERAEALGVENFLRNLSRTNEPIRNQFVEYDTKMMSGLKIPGRHVINGWRGVKQASGRKFHRYDVSSMRRELMGLEFPSYAKSTCVLPIDFRLEHASRVTRVTLELLDRVDFFTLTTQTPKLLGMEYYANLIRGSQYKVESVLFRVAKEMKFALLSPTQDEVSNQAALNQVPAIEPPNGGIKVNPVAVFDFRSLYPSLIIAHNMCYSTFLGKLRSQEKGGGFLQGIGVDDAYMPPRSAFEDKDARENFYVSPNGCVFSKDLPGVLPTMLKEIIATRIMLKGEMRIVGNSDPHLMRVLHARQFCLKMLANTTYGYVTAALNGRMPNAYISNAIVASGRRALETAKREIETSQFKGDPTVVYGDTDSVFVELRNLSAADAFKEAREIASEVSRWFPRPMELEFEKLYWPFVGLAKKRYFGIKYESLEEIESSSGSYEHKGTEIVRRDGFPFMQKTLDECVRVAVETRNLNEMKKVYHRRLKELFNHEVNPWELVRTGAIKRSIKRDDVSGAFLKYASPQAHVLVAWKAYANELEKDDKEDDARAHPSHKERVAYVLAKEEHSTNAQAGKDPVEFMSSDMQYGAKRYAQTLGSAAVRWFRAFGVDANAWMKDLRAVEKDPTTTADGRGTLQDYGIYQKTCVSCLKPSPKWVCLDCADNPARAAKNAYRSFQLASKEFDACVSTCRGCEKSNSSAVRTAAQTTEHDVEDPIACVNDACPKFFERKQALFKCGKMSANLEQAEKLFHA